MNLVKYRPEKFMSFLDRDLNKVFDSFFSDFPRNWNTAPAIDIKENEGGYSMEIELPGMTDKDIEVKVEGNLLSISSKKKDEKEEKQKDYVLKERRSYSFSRSFVLPENTDSEKISAEFNNGLLTLDVPKTEAAKPKLLEIKVK
jgi:HSP20 family protein